MQHTKVPHTYICRFGLICGSKLFEDFHYTLMSDALNFEVDTVLYYCCTLQMFAGNCRDSAGVFCNICRENPVIYTDFPCNPVNITGFSLQILQKHFVFTLKFNASDVIILTEANVNETWLHILFYQIFYVV